jgi:hypothetical protein
MSDILGTAISIYNTYISIETVLLSVASFLWVGAATVFGRLVLNYLAKIFPNTFGKNASLKKVKKYRRAGLDASRKKRRAQRERDTYKSKFENEELNRMNAESKIVRLNAAIRHLLHEHRPPSSPETSCEDTEQFDRSQNRKDKNPADKKKH